MRCFRLSGKTTINRFILLSFFFISSFLAAQSSAEESFPDSLSSEEFVMAKSPWGAVARSAVIPGWGQIYNESYWKAPILWGIMAYYVYEWIDNNNLYQDYSDLYDRTVSGETNFSEAQLLSLRNSARDNRDLFAIYFGIAYVLGLVDAYVDAQLFDFNLSREPFTGSMRLNVKLNF